MQFTLIESENQLMVPPCQKGSQNSILLTDIYSNMQMPHKKRIKTYLKGFSLLKVLFWQLTEYQKPGCAWRETVLNEIYFSLSVEQEDVLISKVFFQINFPARFLSFEDH